VVLKADGVSTGGYRVFFDGQCPDNDLDRGIENRIKLNALAAEAAAKRVGGGTRDPPPRVWEAYRRVTSRSVWIRRYLSAQNPGLFPQGELEELHSGRNPASIYERLGLNAVIGDMDDRGLYLQAQTDPANYRRVHGNSNQLCFPRPERVWRFHTSEFSARSLCLSRFPCVALGAGGMSLDSPSPDS